MLEERLNGLMHLYVSKDLVISVDEVIEMFSSLGFLHLDILLLFYFILLRATGNCFMVQCPSVLRLFKNLFYL